jgi:hypothetical protein
LPPSKLLIKEGAIYMLIRSLNVEKGLCNGTRFVVHNCENKFMLVCRHICGIREGELFYLPRLLLSPTEKYPFSFQRRQFPCIPAFAITINKCQGSTFQELGVDLSSDVFSHGQAYVAYSRVRGWSHLHVLLPEGASSARNIVSREVLDMDFHDSSPAPTSFHPEHAGSHQHWRTEVDADRDEEALADNYDVLQDVTAENDEYAGHYYANDDDYIDHDAQQPDSAADNAEAGDSLHGQCDDAPVGASAAAVAVPQCMAQTLPYVIEGYNIDFKAKYYVASAGRLTLQPKSYLTIIENKRSWVLELNSLITAMRVHNIAFSADLESYNNQQQHPVRWFGKSAEHIRSVLAREFLLLTREQQLKMVQHAAGGTAPCHAHTAAHEDGLIARYAHDLGTDGTFMPTAVFWLISQVCVVAYAMKGKNMRSRSAWSPFSICLFEIDSESLGPGNTEVKVNSNNLLDWSALVHCTDNANLTVVTLACVLLNGHYYAAEICPKQIAGAMFHTMIFSLPPSSLYGC